MGTSGRSTQPPPQRGCRSIRSGFHRASRYPFAASIELTDVRSDRLLSARTTNLGLFGCYVQTTGPFPPGTKASLRITHADTSLPPLGEVAHRNQNSGIVTAFTAIEPPTQS